MWIQWQDINQKMQKKKLNPNLTIEKDGLWKFPEFDWFIKFQQKNDRKKCDKFENSALFSKF